MVDQETDNSEHAKKVIEQWLDHAVVHIGQIPCVGFGVFTVGIDPAGYPFVKSVSDEDFYLLPEKE